MTIYATVAGNIGKDGELKHVGSSSRPVVNFSVAAKNGKEGTTWVRCALFGPRATALASHLVKGKPVTVMGPLTSRMYDGKTYFELDVQELVLQGGSKEAGDSSRAPKSEGHGFTDSDAEEIPF